MRAYEYTSKKELIVDALQEEILTGQLRPGETLRQDDLAARFGVSITPVREALRELGARGLLDHEAHRGVKVAEATMDGHEELAEIRAMLESYAARLATPWLTEADLTALDALVGRMEAVLGTPDVGEFRQLNYDFHMLVYEACGNALLIPLIRQTWAAFEWSALMLIPSRMEVAVEEHQAIVAALRARDADAAELVMGLHVRNGAAALIAFGTHAEQAHPAPHAV
jgi:DNA-binding GntR family transcriptional regulator